MAADAILGKEGGIQVLVGLAPSSQIVENLTAAKPTGKMIYLKNVSYFTLILPYTFAHS
jgi:hypothetical protein